MKAKSSLKILDYDENSIAVSTLESGFPVMMPRDKTFSYEKTEK